MRFKCIIRLQYPGTDIREHQRKEAKMQIQKYGEESLSLLEEKALSDIENDSIEAESTRLFPPRPHMDLISRCLRSTRPSLLRTISINLATGLAPSFLRKSHAGAQQRLSPTAYLDGMRGLAALFVFFCHYSYTCFVITVGYGYGEPGENTSILQLPIIRLLYSGPPMVCVFFIISGYALSLKPLKQMRAKQWDSLFTTMSSSVFRRGLRLFIPTLSSCLLVLVMLRLGWYEPTRTIASDKGLHRNVHEHHPLRMKSSIAQLYDWTSEMFRFICVFDWTGKLKSFLLHHFPSSYLMKQLSVLLQHHTLTCYSQRFKLLIELMYKNSANTKSFYLQRLRVVLVTMFIFGRFQLNFALHCSFSSP